ncbi:MAG: dodecin domain-containing protein, partial [Candidatus Poribacteria bacterium]|nr:dodecin domain-containing protein [Candidatus Poribacteria bacterium]
EVEAVSPHSWEDAARRAVANAATSLSSITEVEVVRQTGTVEYGNIKEYYVTLRIYSSHMADMLKQQANAANVSDPPPVITSNSADLEGAVQPDPVPSETTDSRPTDVYASTPSPVETQHEMAKHYQEIHNLGEKEKGRKNRDG